MKIQKSVREQGFYYIIPAVLAEQNSPRKALLYGLISSLVNEKGYCWATNEFLTKKLGMKSRAQISGYLNSLEKEGWIRMDIEKESGNARKIFLVTPIMENHNTPIMENHTRSYGKPGEGSYGKPEESIISISNINEYIRDVFDVWNQKGGIKHRNIGRFKGVIIAALKTYSCTEIKQAIDNYGRILRDPDYWWSYKWTLDQFLTRKSGVDRFLPENFRSGDYLKNPPVDGKAELNGTKKVDELIEKKLGVMAGEDRIADVLETIDEKHWHRVRRFLDTRYKRDINGPAIFAAAERRV
ncbi:MAG: helix-turn-helix domain-containing protein, partial [Candidatus Omnitrophica bacterium]|nr:helix-turn-helix domain-containing protein [Candidatus Omnitrophota bacterium]